MTSEERMALEVAIVAVGQMFGPDSTALPILRRMAAPPDVDMAQPSSWETIDTVGGTAAPLTPDQIREEAARRHVPARPPQADVRMWAPGFKITRERTPPRLAKDGVDEINPNAYSVRSDALKDSGDPLRGPVPPDELAEIRAIDPHDPDLRE